jgi:GAF domain-containing protein
LDTAPVKTAPLPDNEAERLRALREILILDTPPEERFDRLTTFAAEEFDMAITTVTLIDADRQWFKSRVGLDPCETSRDVAFCAHTIHLPDVMVVEDALQDERFFDNPLVTDYPHIRFYAGAPLVLSSGAVLGSFCLIDTKPRTLDAMDLSILRSLRDLAVAELEQRTLP